MIPRLLAVALVTYAAGAQTFQTSNPFYPNRNPFYFEGKVDYDKLNIVVPKNTWEYLQRGIHLQDDLGDTTGAIADYRKSVEMNSIANGTCQIVRTANPSPDPAPCMFTNRLRLGSLLMHDAPVEAISLFAEVLEIDPLRLEVNELIGETYEQIAHAGNDQAAVEAAFGQAIQAYRAELDLSPVTAETIALTGDEANNAHAHWALAQIYGELNEPEQQAAELDLYLKATRRHSDVYPWRIAVARQKFARLYAGSAQ